MWWKRPQLLKRQFYYVSFKYKYRVYNVPIYWKPLYWAYGYSIGFLLYSLIFLQHKTCKIRFHNTQNIVPNTPYIHCLWHQDLPAFFAATFDFSSFEILNHPFWYMKPVHVFLALAGITKIHYGSSGNDGKKAAKQLSDGLAKGCDTFITPDGPAGPIYQFNKGVLHLSATSGVEVLPLSFTYSGAKTLKGWDKKRFPLLFSKVDVYVGKPVAVTHNSFDYASQHIKAAMRQL